MAPAPKSGSWFWSLRILLRRLCVSRAALCPSHTGRFSLVICLPQSRLGNHNLWLYLTLDLALIGNGSGEGKVLPRKDYFFLGLFQDLVETLSLALCWKRKVIKLLFESSWFLKDTAKLLIVEGKCTNFTCMNFCSKWRLAWEGSYFRANWCVDWFMLQWLPKKMLLLYCQHKVILGSFPSS